VSAFNPSDLAEQEARRKLREISDEGLSGEILQEMAGACDSDEFMALLKAVRKGVFYDVGVAFQEFALALMLKTVDGEELAQAAREDARAEAADSRREQREFLGR